MRLPRRAAGVALAVVLLGAAVVLLARAPVGGLSSTAGGYSFVVTGTSPFTFHIRGPDGHLVTRFQLVHEKPLHLIVVRKDLTGYQHVHPAMAPDGTWSIP